MRRNKGSLRDHWYQIKCIHIHIIGVPEGKERKGPEKIFEEVINENFSNMVKETLKSRKHRESHTG